MTLEKISTVQPKGPQELELPSAKLVETIDMTQSSFAKKSSSASTIIKGIGGYVDAIDWIGANSSILSRISQTVESAVENLASSLISLIPMIQLTVLFKQQQVNDELTDAIENIQTENPQIYQTQPSEAVSESQKSAYRQARDKIQKLQIRILQKAEDLTAKIGRAYLKTTYFTYNIVTSLDVLDKKVVKSFFKLFVVTVKEGINSITSIITIAKQHEYIFNLSAPVIDLNSNTQAVTSQASIFIEKLLVCPNVDAVKSVLEAAEIDIVPPNNLEQFRYLMRSARYRNILMEKFDYAMQKGSFVSRVIQFELGNQPSSVRKISAKTVLDTLQAQQKDYNDRLELLKVEIKNEDPSNIDDAVITAKAKQKLDAIEIEASLLKMAVKQTLVVKHQLERPFYYYSLVGSIQKFSLYSAKFVGSCLTIYGKTTLYKVVDAISKDLFDSTCISGVVSFFSFVPLVSQISFKMVNVVIDLSQLSFARQYKPNEYSVEGYYNSFLLEKIKLQKFLNNAYALSMKGAVFLKHAVARQRAQEVNEDDYQTIEAQQTEFNKTLKQERKVVLRNLKELKNRDLDRALSSTIKDGVQIITDTLSNRNFRYYPAETLEFLNRNLNLGLSELDTREDLSNIDTKELTEKVTELYTADPKDFLELIHRNDVSHYTAV